MCSSSTMSDVRSPLDGSRSGYDMIRSCVVTMRSQVYHDQQRYCFLARIEVFSFLIILKQREKLGPCPPVVF